MRNMPLVVPGLMTSAGDGQGEWMNKLMGKKLSDSTSDATVRRMYSASGQFCC